MVEDESTASYRGARPYLILVAVDYSKLSEVVVAEALRLADSHGAKLHFVTVAEGAGPGLPEELMADEKQSFVRAARETLESFLTRQFSRLKSVDRDRIQSHVRFGDPEHEIVALAHELDADLIVVGSRGRHGIDQAILGSVAERVLRHIACSVLVVRPKHRESD